MRMFFLLNGIEVSAANFVAEGVYPTTRATILVVATDLVARLARFRRGASTRVATYLVGPHGGNHPILIHANGIAEIVRTATLGCGCRCREHQGEQECQLMHGSGNEVCVLRPALC
jgi:hypothetical protein